MSAKSMLAALSTVMLLACATLNTENGADVVAYEDGQWWDGSAFRQGTRYVRDGVFVAPSRNPARTVDLAGGFVLPAFAEAHHHRICDQRGTDRFLDAGVVYVGVMNARTSSRACQAEQHGPEQVEVMNALAGITAHDAHPSEIGRYFLQPDQIDGEWVHYVDTAADIDRIWPRIEASPPDIVKVYLGYSEEYGRLRDDATMPPWYRGLDPALIPEIVERAHARGLRVAAHVLSAHDFDVAVSAGVDVIAHLPGFAPGPAFTFEETARHAWLDALMDQPERYTISATSARAAARAGVVVMTTVSGVEELPSPAPAGAERFIALQHQVTEANIRQLRAAGVTLLIGSDRYDFTSIDEARYLVSRGMFTPRQAVQSLSVDTPRALFPHRNIGSLDRGAEASFVVLRRDPLTDFSAVSEPAMVMKRGRLLRPVAP